MKPAIRTALALSAASSVVVAVTATAIGAPGRSGAHLSLGTGAVFTANERGYSISELDLRTGRVRTVPVSISPHNVQISPRARWLFAVGPVAGAAGTGHHGDSSANAEHSAGEPGRLLVLDTYHPDLKPVADIPVGPHPAHVIVDREQRRAYVTDADQNAVLVVDVRGRKVARSIPTGAYPHGLRMSPDGQTIYVTNMHDDSVSVLSTKTLKETVRIPVGKTPVQVAVAPNGRRIYVSLADENRVAVVDTVRRSVVARVPVGRKPIQVFVTPDGRYVFVANEGTEGNPDRTVSVLDTRTNRIVKTLTTGRGAHGVVVSADGRRAFVSNSVENTVSVMDVPRLRVLRNIVVGAGPAGISYQPARP